MRKINILLLVVMVSLTASASLGSVSKEKKKKEKPQTELTVEQQRKYDYFFLEATRLKANKEYAAAFDLLKHALTIDPFASSALYEISQYYLFLKQIPQAQQSLEQAVANAPDNYWYSQALATLYQQQSEPDKAISVLEAMTIRFTTKQEPLFSLLELYNQQQDFKQVISTLNRLEDKIGKSEQLTMEKFRVYLQMGDDKKAYQEIESLVQEYPMDLRYQVILGDVYMQNGKKTQAYDTYQKVLAAEPDNALALFSLTSYYDQTEQPELYEKGLNTLLLNKKVSSETKLDVMRQVIVQGEASKKDSTEIIALFNRVIQEDSEDTQLPMLYTQYLLSKGMEEASIPVLEQIIQIDPTNTAARMTLLGYAVRTNDFEQVIRLCEAGVEASPETLEFYFYLAIAYNQAGRLDDVLRVSNNALQQTTPESKKEVVSDFYSIMGDVYHTKKMMSQAYAVYDSALVYNPANIGALNNYAYYLSVERRDLDKAEEMSYKTVKAEPSNSTYLDTYAWILFEKKDYAQARIYIDDAMKRGGEESDVIVEHCGDIYYMTGDVEGGMKYWLKAQEMGNDSEILKRKIKKQKYIAE